jgi:hypothetical protein
LAGEQITAETRLQAVHQGYGYAAGFNIDQLKSMASAMQKRPPRAMK